MIRGVLFDLDETLYDEADFVAGGFRAVADEIAGIGEADAAEIVAFLHEELARHGRGRIFDAALLRFGGDPTPERIGALVETYRGHRPAIGLFPDARRVLERLRPGLRLAIVTDGLPAMQRSKIAALGLDRMVDTAIFCWEIDAPKPDPRGFWHALECLGVAPEEALVVGDRPDHDIAAARTLGARSVRVRRGRYADSDAGPHAADREIASLDDLPEILAAWGMGGMR